MFIHPLLSFREKSGLNQAQVASSLKITEASVSRIENGRQMPSFDVCDRIEKLTEGLITIRHLKDAYDILSKSLQVSEAQDVSN